MSEVVEHELGHALGLLHDECPNGIMNLPLEFGSSSIHDSECYNVDLAARLPDEPADSCVDPPVCEHSPLVVNLSAGPPRFSGLSDPVWFDINGDGLLDKISWTARHSMVAFLCLDRNQNGAIDDGAELFGNFYGSNGFDALAVFDLPSDDDVFYGGNGDGRISAHDAVWSRLLLWVDRDHDGRSAATELRRLEDTDITAIDLAYWYVGRTDEHGNELRYGSRVQRARAGDERIYDVWFVAE